MKVVALLLVWAALVCGHGYAHEQEGHAREKRQYHPGRGHGGGRRPNRGQGHGHGNSGGRQSYSGPQKFVKDPRTGQYVAVSDPDVGGNFGGNVGGYPGGGNFGGSPGGNFGGSHGGNFGGSPGGNFGGSPGGNFGGSPGGNFGGSPGGNFGGSPGGNFGGSHGAGGGAGGLLVNGNIPVDLLSQVFQQIPLLQQQQQQQQQQHQDFTVENPGLDNPPNVSQFARFHIPQGKA